MYCLQHIKLILKNRINIYVNLNIPLYDSLLYNN